MTPSSVLEARAENSQRRIEEFRNLAPDKVKKLRECPNLGIYTTGSFGRGEAGEHSDLDLFFVHQGPLIDKDNKPVIGKLRKTLIDADLIRLCEELKYPEFSKDGEYLKIHTISDLATKIGSQQEDAENVFTARMLLFLESTPLYNDVVYGEAIGKCVSEYCRDYKDHMGDFRPTFLANDITRFWKTLCLNYEHARTGIEEERDQEKKQEKKAKHKLKNLKLKFSRMMTCYSMVACLCDLEEADSPEKLAKLVRMKPTERVRHISQKHKQTDLFGQLIAEYEWFLEATGQDEKSTLAWIVDNHKDAFRRAKLFGDMVFELVQRVAKASNSDLFRYLVV